MTELTEKQKADMEAAWRAFYGPGPDDLELIDTPILFKAGYRAAVNRECVWTWKDDPDDVFVGGSTFTSCGVAILQTNETFCPNCGGKVVEGNEKAQEALKAAEEVDTEK